jgi:glycosyltransferase involved in cell wall biosynthesis
MRIVLSNGTRGWWGTAEMARKLALGLRARGHEVTIFTRAGTEVHERLRDAAPCEPILSGIEAHPVALWRCRQALDRLKPDVVIAHTDKDIRAAGLMAKLMGIPVVLREETDRPLRNRLRYRLYYGWVPDHHIAVSHATVRTLCGSVSWIRDAKMSVIPNGVETEVYTEAQPAELGLPAGSIAVGFVGRFEARKGILDLARAWPRVAEEVPHAHLVIAGRGPAEADFRRALSAAPRVHWLGFRTDVDRVMAALDVFAFPSHWEGFGLALVESMLASTPVVACRTSNIPEIVTDGVEGRLVPPEAPELLAEALIELARDAGLRQRMASAGRARAVRDYSLDLMIERHESLLQRLVAAHRDRRPIEPVRYGDDPRRVPGPSAPRR